LPKALTDYWRERYVGAVIYRFPRREG